MTISARLPLIKILMTQLLHAEIVNNPRPFCTFARHFRNRRSSVKKRTIITEIFTYALRSNSPCHAQLHIHECFSRTVMYLHKTPYGLPIYHGPRDYADIGAIMWTTTCSLTRTVKRVGATIWNVNSVHNFLDIDVATSVNY